MAKLEIEREPVAGLEYQYDLRVVDDNGEVIMVRRVHMSNLVFAIEYWRDNETLGGLTAYIHARNAQHNEILKRMFGS